MGVTRPHSGSFGEELRTRVMAACHRPTQYPPAAATRRTRSSWTTPQTARTIYYAATASLQVTYVRTRLGFRRSFLAINIFYCCSCRRLRIRTYVRMCFSFFISCIYCFFFTQTSCGVIVTATACRRAVDLVQAEAARGILSQWQ